MTDLLVKIDAVMSRKGCPEAGMFTDLLLKASDILENEDPSVRPLDEYGRTGGLVFLHPGRTTVVIPDIHGRMDLVRGVLDYPVPVAPGIPTDQAGETESLIQALQNGRAQLLCLGDYVHGESRVYSRWKKALEEFFQGYRTHRHMDLEMAESLGTVEILLRLKAAWPESVHLLKGNHENISNEEGGGNFPFHKFVEEGAMVAEYMRKFYPSETTGAFYRVEKNYPLLAGGNCFLASHAEPVRPFTKEEVIGYRERDYVVQGLTWTDNGESFPGSVDEMFNLFLPDIFCGVPYYFGGHRPVSERFSARAGGRYIQLHNPQARIAAVLPADRQIEPDRDIVLI